MTSLRTVRIGTRASALARAQTDWVITQLGGGASVQVVPVSTHGDRSSEPMTQIGGTGVFVSALREALLESRIDVAVHSFKDLPVGPAAGIALAAVPTREDPRDALAARDGLSLTELPRGARIGTGSARRAAQLRALGLGLVVEAVRGNVDTRLAMVAEGRLDAVVIALAGARRLGREDAITEILDTVRLLPAPAQGALAVECRCNDEETLAMMRNLEDNEARITATAERAVLAALGAGCSAPIGALADVTGPEVRLRASVTAPDGSAAVASEITGSTTHAEDVGQRLAADLIASGAEKMMESSR